MKKCLFLSTILACAALTLNAHANRVTDTKIVQASDGKASTCESALDTHNRGFRFSSIEVLNLGSDKIELRAKTWMATCLGESGWEVVDPWENYSFPIRYTREDGEFDTTTVHVTPSKIALVGIAADRGYKVLGDVSIPKGKEQSTSFSFNLSDLLNAKDLIDLETRSVTVRVLTFYKGIYHYLGENGLEVGPKLENSGGYFLLLKVEKDETGSLMAQIIK